MLDKDYYLQLRSELLTNKTAILETEKYYMQLLLDEIIIQVATAMYRDFSTDAQELIPFWINYPPEQRGRMPTGQSIPLLELGEKAISFNLIKGLINKFPDITFPGLPTGGDVRFATSNALIHLDIKVTGPNDNPNEIVVPPNQVSGDGYNWNNGVINSRCPVYYQTGSKGINYHFQPKLPPFYFLNGQVLLCLTFFLKAIYNVKEYGIQPLQHFELVCVPNGLLMFEGDYYANTKGLIISGKDDKTIAEDSRRIRIRLNPLAQLENWRCIKMVLNDGVWQTSTRI